MPPSAVSLHRSQALDEQTERTELRIMAEAAIRAYVACPSSAALTTATVALEAYRRHYGPLTVDGWCWWVDRVGDLCKWRAAKPGRLTK